MTRVRRAPTLAARSRLLIHRRRTARTVASAWQLAPLQAPASRRTVASCWFTIRFWQWRKLTTPTALTRRRRRAPSFARPSTSSVIILLSCWWFISVWILVLVCSGRPFNRQIPTYWIMNIDWLLSDLWSYFDAYSIVTKTCVSMFRLLIISLQLIESNGSLTRIIRLCCMKCEYWMFRTQSAEEVKEMTSADISAEEAQRLATWSTLATHMTPSIQRVVEFAKRVPGKWMHLGSTQSNTNNESNQFDGISLRFRGTITGRSADSG